MKKNPIHKTGLSKTPNVAWLAAIRSLGVFIFVSIHPSFAQGIYVDSTHPAQTRNWVDTRLYFGLGPADSPEKGVTEVAWRDFLDREVTPRFPSGLSVVDVYGQWLSKPVQGARPRLERIRSKLLIIDYPATAANAARIEAIRAAWKRQTGDQSVLKVTQPADISF